MTNEQIHAVDNPAPKTSACALLSIRCLAAAPRRCNLEIEMPTFGRFVRTDVFRAVARARYIFGSGGDTPNMMAAVGRLATAAARGAAPPPEPGLLERLRRDRERRASVVIDRLSFVASPNGFLTAARAATALESAMMAAWTPPYIGTADATKGPEPANALRPSAPLPLRPLMSTTVHVQVAELKSLLSLESRPLASLSMSGLAFEASRSEWWDLDEIEEVTSQPPGGNAAPPSPMWGGTTSTAYPKSTQTAAEKAQARSMPTAGWPGWTWTRGRHRKALGYLRICLQGVGVLDLTTDGQLHSEVVSHAKAADVTVSAAHGATATPTSMTGRRSSANRTMRAHETAARWAAAEQPPVVVVEVIPARFGGGGEVNASVHGLRVCFLRRFMAEVTKYFGPDGLGPVFAVARRVGGGRSAADGPESEAPDRAETVAIVVGEEDEAIPDNWSVLSLDGEDEDGVKTVRGSGDAVSSGTGNVRTSSGRVFDSVDEAVSSKSEVDMDMEAGMRITAVLEDVAVVIPRSTHSRESAAVKCDELVLEVLYVLICFGQLLIVLNTCGKSTGGCSIHRGDEW